MSNDGRSGSVGPDDDGMLTFEHDMDDAIDYVDATFIDDNGPVILDAERDTVTCYCNGFTVAVVGTLGLRDRIEEGFGGIPHHMGEPRCSYAEGIPHA